MRSALLAALFAAGLSGCSFTPKAKADPTEFFVLAAAPVSQHAAGKRPVVELADVEVPDYLRNPRMAARSGANEIDYAEFKRWAEPLDKGVARVLREGLAPAADVRASPAKGAAFRLTVRLLAFEGRRGDGAAHVQAVWELKTPGGKTVHRKFDASEPGWDGKDYSRLAALESAALAALCAELAKTL